MRSSLSLPLQCCLVPDGGLNTLLRLQQSTAPKGVDCEEYDVSHKKHLSSFGGRLELHWVWSSLVHPGGVGVGKEQCSPAFRAGPERWSVERRVRKGVPGMSGDPNQAASTSRQLVQRQQPRDGSQAARRDPGCPAGLGNFPRLSRRPAVPASGQTMRALPARPACPRVPQPPRRERA